MHVFNYTNMIFAFELNVAGDQARVADCDVSFRAKSNGSKKVEYLHNNFDWLKPGAESVFSFPYSP